MPDPKKPVEKANKKYVLGPAFFQNIRDRLVKLKNSDSEAYKAAFKKLRPGIQTFIETGVMPEVTGRNGTLRHRAVKTTNGTNRIDLPASTGGSSKPKYATTAGRHLSTLSAGAHHHVGSIKWQNQLWKCLPSPSESIFVLPHIVY